MPSANKSSVSKRAASKAANASQDSISTRRSSERLAGKPAPDINMDSRHVRKSKKPLEIVHERENEQEHSQEEGSGTSNSESSEEESGELTHHDEESQPESCDSDHDEEEVQTSNDETDVSVDADPRRTCQDLKQIEQETRDRISALQKRLEAEQKAKKSAASKKKKAKLAALKSENERRATIIEQLQQQEDELFEKVQKLKTGDKGTKNRRRSKVSTELPSAQSTPKTAGEYNCIIQGLLNMSFNENDLLMTDNQQKRLAPNKLREIQSILEQTLHDNKTNELCVAGKKHKQGRKRKEHEMSSSEEEGVVSDDSQTTKKGKLKSGKCAKIDSIDIKKQVSYPHSKLNREFVRYTNFDDLPLNIFAAGEIELILRTRVESERLARLNILLMCLYHSQFLDINEIRDQYDVLMKSVERGEYHWVDNLGDKIDRALDRRA